MTHPATRPSPGEAGRPAAETSAPGEATLLRSVPGAPLDASIPWAHRLSTKLVGVVAALTVAAVVAFFIAETRMQGAVLRQMGHGAVLFSEAVQGATRRAMMEDRRGDAYETMRAIARQDGVERVRVLNKEGRVTFSTDAAEIGQLVDKRAEACFACHTADQPLSRLNTPSRSRVYDAAGGHRVMGLITPIYNDRTCSTAECHHHTPGQQVLGVLDVGLSLEAVDDQIATFRRNSLVITAVGVIFLAGFFLYFARQQVLRPVAQLLHATRAVATDRLEFELPVRSGEMGLLAASFNDMTRSVLRLENELLSLTHDLERQVEDRTSDLRRAQAQLVQSEKLSSLGRLSASIAHEINNPLAGILTFAKLVVRTLEQGPLDETSRRGIVKNLQLVQRETERCSAIVRNLLDFARERPLTLREVSVNAVVEEGISLIAHQIQIQGVKLERTLGEVPLVHADFGQLRQAFVNVTLNACEAMGKGGVLRIATRRVEDDVELVISDSGPGIPQEHLNHIFDPFFTTKEKGTGLGLSVVYGIVQRHGGRIEVQSEQGKGTTFTVRLPALRGPQAAPPEKAS